MRQTTTASEASVDALCAAGWRIREVHTVSDYRVVDLTSVKESPAGSAVQSRTQDLVRSDRLVFVLDRKDAAPAPPLDARAAAAKVRERFANAPQVILAEPLSTLIVQSFPRDQLERIADGAAGFDPRVVQRMAAVLLDIRNMVRA